MEPNARFRRNVRGFYFWIGSMVVFGAAPLAALRLLQHGTTLVERVAAVVLGVGGMLPWMWMVFATIRRGDEFVRRQHMVALAFAFAGALVLLLTTSWLVRADFIDPPDLMLVLFGCMLLWFVAIVGAKLHFERER